MDRPTVALDAMGSEDAPVPEILAASRFHAAGVRVRLVGDPLVVEREARRRGCFGALDVLAAGRSGRGWPGARPSLRLALEQVRTGEASAMVTAGNVGALLVASVATLRRTPGVERPALAVELPTLAGPVVLTDAGANSHCTPSHLLGFARLARAAFRATHPGREPAVALLSNGRDPEKGRELTREATRLLRASEIDFVGHLEPHEMLRGGADVVVTDGFNGNTVLKAIEGTRSLTRRLLLRAGRDGLPAAIGLALARGAIRRRCLDVIGDHERGGMPLLGVEGTVVVVPERSGPGALCRAVEQAVRLATWRCDPAGPAGFHAP